MKIVTPKVIMEQSRDWQHASDCSPGRDIDLWIYGYPLRDEKWLDAAGAIELYCGWGWEKLTRDTSGEYTIIIDDRRAGRHLAITGYFGAYTPYWNGEVVSSSIADFLPARLNRAKVLEYLNWWCGTRAMPLGRTTYLEGVYRFPPASVTDLDTGESRCYWNPFRKVPAASVEMFVEHFQRHIANALNACGQEPVVLSITGGLDTRSILAGILSCKGKVSRAFTHWGEDRDDDLAQQICAHYRIPHTLYQDDDGSYQRLADPLNGMVLGLTYRPIISSVKKEAEKGSGTLFMGLGGNEVWRHRSLDTSSPEALVKSTCTSVYFPSLPPVYAVDIWKVMTDRAAEILKDAPAEHADDWLMWQNMIPNWAGALIPVLGKHFRIYDPILSKDLAEIMFSLPSGLRQSGKCQKEIIAQYPYLATLPYDTMLTSSTVVRKTASLGRVVLTSRFVPRSLRRFGSTVSGTSTVTEQKRQAALKMLPLLEWDRMKARDIFDRQKLGAYIASGANPPWVIRLASLEMWLQGMGDKIK